MNRLDRATIVIRLCECLASEGSWCGETHIQKAAYMLQALDAPEVDWNFTLYKHGPFSFDLRDEITMMRADNFLSREVKSAGYGPSYRPGPAASTLLNRSGNIVDLYDNRIQFIASAVGSRGVASLERLSTALYVTRQNADASIEVRACALHNLKPHVTLDDARSAISEIDKVIKMARETAVTP